MVTMPYTFSIGYGIIAGLLLWIAIQLLLAPVRIFRKQDPFVKFKALWAGVFVEGEEFDSQASLSEMDTDLPSTSEAPSEP
mmetsp:Transcript_67524/g.82761  ORF Transcript_67524/g.82761 Transcript_67524/m.82761 type:complete len:81 (-) Transcript_67524:224-466(-)